MGNSTSTKHVKTLSKVSDKVSFYYWCLNYFKKTEISANIFSMLGTFWGYYLVENFKRHITLPTGPSQLTIQLICDQPDLFDARRYGRQYLGPWNLVSETPAVKLSDSGRMKASSSVAYTSEDKEICMVLSFKIVGQWTTSENSFPLSFKNISELQKFIDVPKPIVWPVTKPIPSETTPSAPLKGEEPEEGVPC